MKKYISFILFLFLMLFLQITANSAEKKLAQSGFQFLSIAIDARAAAMGEAYTTVAGNSSSIFFNPANMALMNSFADFSISQNKWIADINYYSGSIAFSPVHGHYGVFALSILSVDYGDFLGTVVDPTLEKGFRDTGIFSPSAFAIGLGYARSLTDRFSVGGQIKYVSQKLGNSILPVGDVTEGVTTEVSNNVNVIAFDFGTIYKTGFRSLIFGMSVRNFSQEIKFQSESFQLPLTFKIGISMNMLDFFKEKENDMHTLLVSIDALHPRAYSERINIGAEYLFKRMFALRSGYNYNYDERGFSAGFGFQLKFGKHQFAIDYAYTPFGVFNTVQRMSFRLSL